ncbi:MAG TPA: YraN family protein [Thermoanaerobaculia bacterium]|jgi:putative endonuclease|nr:YraN family protein [Thermoanaerobaculia bacterium]
MEGFAAQPHTVGRGRVAEAAAARWLVEQGYRVVEQNHRNQAGEIDLVAWDGDTLCFLEVKARAATLYGPAVAAVGWKKRRRLARAAALYLALRRLEPPCRFDVLGVEGDGGEWRFTLVKDAFWIE